MTDYDKYYETEDLFGEPYPELIDFFKQYEPKGKLIDLGCGQGRNSISLARLGYKITGVDNSKLGIDQLNTISKKEKLPVTGLLGDIYDFDDYRDFDIVLLDSMFHFEKRDLEKETGLLRKIAIELKKNKVLCVCIQDTGKKVNIMKKTLNESGVDWIVLNDSSLIYNYVDKSSGHSSKTKYCMYIVKKNKNLYTAHNNTLA